VLSLTIIRMLPVAVALIGSRLGHATVAFVGWFGPRGLASVVFGLLTLEDLGGPAAKPVTAVIAFTVLLSVIAHGLTADPLARRYGPKLSLEASTTSAAQMDPVPERRLIRRSPAVRRQADAGLCSDVKLKASWPQNSTRSASRPAWIRMLRR
jgi:NhaP-type Na+/H+ or K+/H+ antiporter